MAVRIRLKRMGRRHRPFFRVCAMDARSPRDGRVIEELGYYDPMVPEVDARAILKGERVDYWLSVGAQPTPKVQVLIKKYGSNGTHLEQQREALERLKIKPQAPPPQVIKAPEPEQPEEATEEAAAAENAEGEPAPAEETSAAENAEAQSRPEASATEAEESQPAAETTDS